MPDKSEGYAQARKKTLVRGADGSLYVVSKDAKPIKLSPEDTQKVNQMLNEAEERLSARLHSDMPIVGSGVTLMLPEIFL